jgi:hypothetical protein
VSCPGATLTGLRPDEKSLDAQGLGLRGILSADRDLLEGGVGNGIGRKSGEGF